MYITAPSLCPLPKIHQVGVVGSDRKMTVNVDGRKKHIFKESAMAEDD